jgi:hypothetical protein
MAIAELDTETVKARPGSRLSDKFAQAIAPELLAIERRDGLATPAAVVEAARDPSSELHFLFDWDDASAAQKQRLQTARMIIRSVVYRVQSIGANVNDYTAAFVSVRETAEDDDEVQGTPDKQGYASITRVLSEEKLRKQMTAALARDMGVLIRKMETIRALENALGKARELLEEIKAA